jgi:hypothetical protein
LTIGGSGNFPLIEAPELRVPAGIERFDTKSSHQIRQDGTGFKTFEYLLLPRSGGTLTIPSLAWSYFDPQTESYKILKSPELVLSIEGEARVAQTPKSPEAPSYKIFVGPQDFHPTNQSSSPWRYLLLAQGLVFVGLFVAYRYDKKLQAQAALHRAQPWLVTEAEIRKLNPRDFKRRASLCDRWMRERIAGLLKLQVDSETPRAEVLGLLRNATPGELERIESLRALWEELDWVRFSGSQETPNQDSDWLLRCQKIAVAMDRSLPTKTSSE